MLKIGRNTAYELVRANIIASVRVGRNIRIPKDEIIAYLTQNNAKEVQK
jgi:excisionase family DNA binding protein